MIEQIYIYFTLNMIYLWLNIGVLPFWFILIFFPNSKINQILELGHDVGLHFDLSVYDKKTKKDITHNIKWEKKILSELLNKKISVF